MLSRIDIGISVRVVVVVISFDREDAKKKKKTWKEKKRGGEVVVLKTKKRFSQLGLYVFVLSSASEGQRVSCWF